MPTLLNRPLVAASALCVLLAFSGLARSEDGPWTTDFKAAQAKAKKESKYLLVNFTGSDWCVWCKKLEAEVFEKENFLKEAPKQFVLVVLDFPQEKKQPDELKKQNQELQKKYKIQGFPTILLLDAAGEIVAKTGYQPDGPEKYLASLDGFVKTYKGVLELKAKLASLKGLDRAKALDQLVDSYEKLQNESSDIEAWSKEIIQLDAKNEAGLKSKYEIRLLIAEAEQYAENEQFEKAKQTFDKLVAIKGVSAEQKQNAFVSKAQCDLALKNFVGVVESLKKAIEADPSSKLAPQLTTALKTLEKKAEAQATLAKIAAELDKAKGLDRAKILDRMIEAKRSIFDDVQGVPAVNPGGVLGHQLNSGSILDDKEVEEMQKWCKEIVAIDADGKAKLKRKYEFRAVIAEAEIAFREKDFEAVQTLLDKGLALPNLTAEEKQGLFFLKADVFLMLKDLQSALDFTTKSFEASSDKESPFAKMLEERLNLLKTIEANLAKQREDEKNAAKTKVESFKKKPAEKAPDASKTKPDSKPNAKPSDVKTPAAK